MNELERDLFIRLTDSYNYITTLGGVIGFDNEQLIIDLFPKYLDSLGNESNTKEAKELLSTYKLVNQYRTKYA